MTRDGRLRDIDAHLFGVKVIYDLTELTMSGPLGDIFENTEIDFLWDRYYQENSFHYDLLQVGLTVIF